MTDSTPVEPVVEARVDNQADEAILRSQRQDEFQSVSPEAQQHLTVQQTQAPSIVTCKGIATSTLTPEEVLAMKQ